MKVKEKLRVNGEKYIEFYGSSSEVANKKHYAVSQIIEVVKVGK